MFAQLMGLFFALVIAALVGYGVTRGLIGGGAPVSARLAAPIFLILAPFVFGLWSANKQFGPLFEGVSSQSSPAPGHLVAVALLFFGISLSFVLVFMLFGRVRNE